MSLSSLLILLRAMMQLKTFLRNLTLNLVKMALAVTRRTKGKERFFSENVELLDLFLDEIFMNLISTGFHQFIP